MICKYCSKEISATESFCTFCGKPTDQEQGKQASGTEAEENKTSEPPKKKKKKGLKIFFIILGSIILIPIILFLVLFFIFLFADEPIVDSVSVEKDEIYFGQDQHFTVSYINESDLEVEQEFEIMVDGDLYTLETVEFYDESTIDIDYTLTYLELGKHTITAGEHSQEFEVVEYTQFEISCEEVDFLVSDVPREVNFQVANLGTYEGDFDINITADGSSLIEKSVFIERGETYKSSFKIISTNDSLSLSVNGNEQTIKVYQPTEMENGQKLMDNTVKGYGYFVINNDSYSDIIYYIVEKDNPDIAVAAAYVKAGETYEFRSFPHGTYSAIIQSGKYWVPELNAFADQNYIVKDKEDMVFKNNVDKVYGGVYTYWTITLVDDLDIYTDYYDILDSAPKLGN